MSEHINPDLLMIEMAAGKLGPLIDVVAFLVRCATGLLITGPDASLMRITCDEKLPECRCVLVAVYFPCNNTVSR